MDQRLHALADDLYAHADEVAPFLALIERDRTLAGATIAVGKGLHLVWRREG